MRKRDILSLAIVGCGSIGSTTALLVRANPRLRAVFACDRAESNAAAFAARHRIPAWGGDYTMMLDRGGFEAVYLAVPHHLHHDMILAAVDAGLPVLSEKPVTRTLAEGRAVTDAAARKGIKLGVNYQHRYNPGCFAMAEAVRSGDLGTVHSARINLPWRRETGYFDNSPWHGLQSASGGGTLITQGSHFLDVVLWALAPDRPVSATGYTARRRFLSFTGRDDPDGKPHEIEVEDLCHGIVEMNSGALVQISSSMVAHAEQPVEIEIYGDRGTVRYRHFPLPHVLFRGCRVRHRRPPVRAIHPLQASLEGFRRWVAEDVPFLIPASDTLRTLAAVEAIYSSARTGRRAAVE